MVYPEVTIGRRRLAEVVQPEGHFKGRITTATRTLLPDNLAPATGVNFDRVRADFSASVAVVAQGKLSRWR